MSAQTQAMRVGVFWNGALQWERLFRRPKKIRCGGSGRTDIPLKVLTPSTGKPSGRDTRAGGGFVLLEPGMMGYQLNLTPDMGGEVVLNGLSTPVSEMGASQIGVALGPEDYGVVTLGETSIFFQQSLQPNRLQRPWPVKFSTALISACLLALTIHLGAAFLAKSESHTNDPLRTAKTSLVKNAYAARSRNAAAHKNATDEKDTIQHNGKFAGLLTYERMDWQLGLPSIEGLQLGQASVIFQPPLAELKSLSSETVDWLRAQQPKLKTCYLQTLDIQPKLQARIMVRLKLVPAGNVTELKLIPSDPRTAMLRSCIERQLQDTRVANIPRNQNIGFALLFSH